MSKDNDRVELHLKFRPKTFEEYLGNDALKKSVLDVIDRTRTFVFYGPRGCGKTTIARLLGIKIGVSDIDMAEIDGADTNGVDAAREIKQAAQFAPLDGKYKLYIIDECHRLTGNAADSLLKTLESPPAHCYFALCTTDFQKVSTTIKSRAKCYEVKPLDEKEQNFLIRWVCHEEKFKVSPAVKAAIIECCEGIPREIIVALDMVRNMENDEEAISLIHAAVHHEVKELCQALLNGRKWGDIAVILKTLKDEPERIRMAVLGYMNAVLLNDGKSNDMAAFIIEEFEKSVMYSGKAGLSKACYMVVKG